MHQLILLESTFDLSASSPEFLKRSQWCHNLCARFDKIPKYTVKSSHSFWYDLKHFSSNANDLDYAFHTLPYCFSCFVLWQLLILSWPKDILKKHLTNVNTWNLWVTCWSSWPSKFLRMNSLANRPTLTQHKPQPRKHHLSVLSFVILFYSHFAFFWYFWQLWITLIYIHNSLAGCHVTLRCGPIIFQTDSRCSQSRVVVYLEKRVNYCLCARPVEPWKCCFL